MVGGILAGLFAGLWGYATGDYSARVLLGFRSNGRDGNELNLGDRETASPPTLARNTLIELIRSGAVLGQTTAATNVDQHRHSPASDFQMSLLPSTDLAVLQCRSQSPNRTVEQANAYAEEAVRASAKVQREQLQETGERWQQRLRALDQELQHASAELVQFQQSIPGLRLDKDPAKLLEARTELERQAEDDRNQLGELERRIDRMLVEIRKQTPALVAAREALGEALNIYTEQHPHVKELRARLASLEAQLAQKDSEKEPDISGWGNPTAANLYANVLELRARRISLIRQIEEANLQMAKLNEAVPELPAKHVEYVQIKSRYQALRDERFLLASRFEQLPLAKATAPLQILRPASVGELDATPKLEAATWYGAAGGILGGLFTTLVFLLLEGFDGRIRSEADLRRASQLPVIASLDDLEPMNASARLLWALHTLIIIQSRTNLPKAGTLICGVASLQHGEGRSTFIQLLAEAARQQGYRVFTITAARPTLDYQSAPNATEPNTTRQLGEDASEVSDDVLMDVSGSLQAMGPWPVRNWTWSIDCREQWEETLQQWAALDRCAILVELPPVSTPEAFLLAEHLPNLIWLSRKNMARETDTRSHLDVLSRLRTNWVGAVFNRAAVGSGRAFSRVLLAILLMAGTLASPPIEAQPAATANPPEAPQPTEPTPPTQPEYAAPPEGLATNQVPTGSLTVTGPEHLAAWQKHLTLGPGDSFSINLYEQPDTMKAGLFIGPDGRLNYLEARDVMAAGLTVDELRAKLEEVLSKFRLSPRVIINPSAYTSKKYYLLGNVNQRGIFLLDRPITIIEAIARSGGFVTSQQYRNRLTQADLGHSFLVRRGSEGSFGRVSVDFEGLFERGDLSQNLPLAPDDYLFFPPLDLQEVYVLGQVNGPGALPFAKEMTVLGAITSRGGFTTRAYKSRVLVVRGSLNRPQTFVVNTADILAARGPDFPLHNRDIIYIHSRPFARAEELLEMATLTFARSFVTAYTGAHVGPFITEPWIK